MSPELWGRRTPLTFVSGELFPPPDRQYLAGAASGDPDDVARRFDRGRRRESFPDHCNASRVGIHGGDGNPAAVLRDDLLAIRRAHAIRTLDRLVHPNLDRLACLASGVHWDALEMV